jgi:putative flavoprotein involved in K+ transport
MVATTPRLEAATSLSVERPVTVLDVLVVGAGQAGLATAYNLRSTGLCVEILERHARIGDSWRARYDSLSLFTPRAYSALPGFGLDGDPDGFPTKDEVADYLEGYAHKFALPVRLSSDVRRLERTQDGFRATLADGAPIEARAVIIASGAYQLPAIPAIASGFSGNVLQLTPLSYQNPTSVPAGTVLVVGDGATGRQIALELALTHRVLLAGGRARTPAPERILGRSIFWWLDHLRLLRVKREGRIGRRMRSRDAFPGRGLDIAHLRAAGIELVPRLTRAEGSTAGFADGGGQEVAGVIWATGYRDESNWLRIPQAVDESGSFVETRGVSPVPGLFFVGRRWQATLGSALLLGVAADAEFIVEQVVDQLRPMRHSTARHGRSEVPQTPQGVA